MPSDIEKRRKSIDEAFGDSAKQDSLEGMDKVKNFFGMDTQKDTSPDDAYKEALRRQRERAKQGY